MCASHPADDAEPALPGPRVSVCLINGAVADTVSVTDRGLQYGDGVFETLVGDAMSKIGTYLLVEFSKINEVSFEIYAFKRSEIQVQKYFEAWALFLIFSTIFLFHFLLLI